MGEEFQIDTEAVRSVVGNVSGLLMQTVTLVLDLDRLVVEPTAYAQIGAEVASGSTALSGGQVTAVQSMLRVLRDINAEVDSAATLIAGDDADIAARLSSRPAGPSQPAGHPTAAVANGADSPASVGGLLGSLWSSPAAGALASAVTSAAPDASVPVGSGHAVTTVLDQLRYVGMGELATQPVAAEHAASPQAFADWLDTDADHQTQVGVIGIYSGNTGTLSNVPGGVHPGDVVYAARWQLGSSAPFLPATDHLVGVVGTDGRLYNNGPIDTEWHGVTDLRVYRPLSSS